MAISENSDDQNVPAVRGVNTGDGRGVEGSSNTGQGVYGSSKKQAGVVGESLEFVGVWGESKSTDQPGVFGKSDNWTGVMGVSVNQSGVSGMSEKFVGGWFESTIQTGVVGKSRDWDAVVGESINHTGVVGKSEKFVGGWFEAIDQSGVVGRSQGGRGVDGLSEKGPGVFGLSNKFVGVYAENQAADHPALFAKNTGGAVAGRFEGDVEVTGDIRLANADCAEDFNVSGSLKVDPGTVMVLGDEGALFESQQAYDKRVAGVISGAGDFKPAIVLDKQETLGNRQPLALMGKVFCKVDAQFGAIEVGDLLTTSSTVGHAMRADDQSKAFGAVIGKALRPLKEGQGLIPILIALQ